jgi:hypothetical protein
LSGEPSASQPAPVLKWRLVGVISKEIKQEKMKLKFWISTSFAECMTENCFPVEEKKTKLCGL